MSNQVHGSSQITASCTGVYGTNKTAPYSTGFRQACSMGKEMGHGFPPIKCSTIRISRSRNSVGIDYTLKGHILETEDCTRYLGEGSSQAYCGTAIYIKRTNSILGFPRRKTKASNEDTKTSAYRSMILPLLEYCSTLWSPHTINYIQKVKMVRRRAARYVTKDITTLVA